jgi:glucuronate isomerase
VDETFITGNTPDREKFMKWAETIPYCLGNPLYHWTHLELKRYFGIEYWLSPKNADKVWQKCNEKLTKDDYRPKELIKRYDVKAIYTTDSPVDTLEYHSTIAGDKSFPTKVFPTMRNDMFLNIDKESFLPFLKKLIESTNSPIKDLDDFKEAILNRIKHFNLNGCIISDHAFESIKFLDAKEEEINRIFKRKAANDILSTEDIAKYKTHMMTFLGREYHRLGWIMQLHIGALRDNNKRMFKLLGPDTGFDSIGNSLSAKDLVKILNALEETGQLPKTILYCLNPGDNEILGSIIGCFYQKDIYSKIQFGPGWWFNDQKDGMEKQMTALANLSLLSRFIGMTTDSRCMISFTRHEYFRRILCNLIGKWVEDGEVPNDMELLRNMLEDICFNNAEEYFKT